MEEMKEQLKNLLKSYEVVQDARIRAESQLRSLPEIRAKSILEKMHELRKVELALSRDMNQILENIPEYYRFLKYIHGIGPTLSAKLISLGLDPNKPPSSWNAFFGLVPKYWLLTCENGHKYAHPRFNKECPVCKTKPIHYEEKKGPPARQRGVIMFFSVKNKSLYYVIGSQFIRTGKYYKDFYYQVKERKQKQFPDYPAGRIHYQALRSTFKLFLNHFYEVSREIAGLPPLKAYHFEYLNNHDFISYKDVLAYENGSVRKAVD